MAVTAFIRPPKHRPRHSRKAGAPAKGPRSFWEIRPFGRSGSLILPPCTLGFTSFLEPDVFGDGKPKLKGNFHFSQVQAETLSDMLQAKVIDAAFDDLKALVSKDKPDIAKVLKEQSAANWLEMSLKEPKEKSRIQLPFLTIAMNAFVKARDSQEEVAQSVKAWDSKGKVLDLPTLHLGMGSIVQAVVSPALWHGTLAVEKDNKKKPIAYWALPSLRLIGVRVLKLEQFSGGESRVGEVTQEELVGVEEGFEAEDLSSFARGESKPTPQAAPEELNTGVTTDGPEEF